MHYVVRGAVIPSNASPPVGAENLAYFCSTCGELWAKYSADFGRPWHILHVPCEAHTPRCVLEWSATPGSLLTWESYAPFAPAHWTAGVHLSILPPALVAREFKLRQHLLEEYA